MQGTLENDSISGLSNENGSYRICEAAVSLKEAKKRLKYQLLLAHLA
jgi:hypothetical protein